LLSDGNGPYETLLVAASSDGSDVIITTQASLVPQDQNNGDGDLYDVRIGGGFPELSLACTGTGCQGASPVPPAFGVPASETFSGPGNVVPEPPAKPKPLTRAQKLAKALKACRTKHNPGQRRACKKQAHKRYSSKSSKGHK
jgi:hypothetical protein